MNVYEVISKRVILQKGHWVRSSNFNWVERLLQFNIFAPFAVSFPDKLVHRRMEAAADKYWPYLGAIWQDWTFWTCPLSCVAGRHHTVWPWCRCACIYPCPLVWLFPGSWSLGQTFAAKGKEILQFIQTFINELPQRWSISVIKFS